MAANFNNSAWFYDPLSRIVYGKALVNAQKWLLNYIPKKANILIVGGGTGWILEDLTRIHPDGLTITYIEVSANMITRSKKRVTGNNEVFFINNAIENVVLPADFDVVITPFLFDNFIEETLQRVFYHINKLLKPDGLWLNVDFQLTGRWWQNILLKTMFIFFRLICGIEASKLPAIEKRFEEKEYEVNVQKTFFGDFILSTVYKSSGANKL